MRWPNLRAPFFHRSSVRSLSPPRLVGARIRGGLPAAELEPGEIGQRQGQRAERYDKRGDEQQEQRSQAAKQEIHLGGSSAGPSPSLRPSLNQPEPRILPRNSAATACA